MFNTKRIEELEEKLAFLVESIYGKDAEIVFQEKIHDYGCGIFFSGTTKKIVKVTKGVDKEEVFYPKPLEKEFVNILKTTNKKSKKVAKKKK
jgi:hypothetical protein